jgi:predicted PolB exonuclease-like 3'-5' exonuclease
MASSTFNMAKVSFTASFQTLLDNYISRSSNEKYSWMDNILSKMRENLERAREVQSVESGNAVRLCHRQLTKTCGLLQDPH